MFQHHRESDPQGVCTLVIACPAILRQSPFTPPVIPPTIAAANTFPGTRVMILLYYANYAVAAHGQWCILMAIVAQRGAIAIDQSCSGYANSSSTWRTRKARRVWNARRGGGGRERLMEDDRNVEMDNDKDKTILQYHRNQYINNSIIIYCDLLNIDITDIEIAMLDTFSSHVVTWLQNSFTNLYFLRKLGYKPR